ncbi:hypothetical protein E2C01_089584 [Portunus trituberculatus]|uniref:Uncharacterized protein n=1 Tax=Portunus trituberculatus TaxID=210409 RepID=A0A5B7JMU1_PORTR|nr:hypothetical protein [Portunus trituberculatus]
MAAAARFGGLARNVSRCVATEPRGRWWLAGWRTGAAVLPLLSTLRVGACARGTDKDAATVPARLRCTTTTATIIGRDRKLLVPSTLPGRWLPPPQNSAPPEATLVHPRQTTSPQAPAEVAGS